MKSFATAFGLVLLCALSALVQVRDPEPVRPKPRAWPAGTGQPTADVRSACASPDRVCIVALAPSDEDDTGEP